jgi:hypothetical protein
MQELSILSPTSELSSSHQAPVISTTWCEKYELIYEGKSKAKAILVYFNRDFTTATHSEYKQYNTVI